MTQPDRGGLVRPLVVLALSSALIFVSADGTIGSVIEIAAMLDIGSEIIAASVVAFGTSLPEVSVTIAAARRGNAEIWRLATFSARISSTRWPSPACLPVLARCRCLPSLIGFAVPIMLIATLLVYFIIMQQEMTRWEGWLLILFYVFFIAELFEWI